MPLALAYLAYSPGLDGPWLLDDSVNIQPLVLQELSWPQIRANVFTSSLLGGLSRSLSMLTLALTEFIYGADTYPYKYQNLLLHLANALLVFWFVRLLFLSAETPREPEATWAALAVTALWVLHPLQVSTVLYVVQRLVLLAAFFCLLALCLYLEGRLLARHRPMAGAALMLIALGLLWPLAIVSKENAVLLAVILPLLELFVLRFQTHSTRERTLLMWVLGVFVALPLIIATFYFMLRIDVLLGGYVGRDFTMQERLMTEVHVIWLYLKLIAFPIPGLMTLNHDYFPIQRAVDANTIVATAGLLMAALAALLLRRRAALIGFGVLWFFCWHLLESTFLSLELVFEHRNYLPLMGVALALVAGAVRLYRIDKLKVPLAAAGLALVALLGLNTTARAFVWSSFPLMVEADYHHHSQSPRVLEGLVVVEMRRQRPQVALRYVEELKRVAPDASYPWLREVLIRCDLPGGAGAAFAEALALARTERLRPATNKLTGKLMIKVHLHGCTGVSGTDVVALTTLLVENERTHSSTSRLAALSTHAMATMLYGDPLTAEQTLGRLIKAAYAQSPSKFADTIEVAATVASQLPTEHEAVNFLDRVTRDYIDVLSERQIRVYISAPLTAHAEKEQPTAVRPHHNTHD